MKKFLLILIPILLLAGAAYYWFFMRSTPVAPNGEGTLEDPSFNPFGKGNVAPSNGGATDTSTGGGITTEPVGAGGEKQPILRHLSLAPIGGYMASSTASSTLVRYVDRGVGHVYEVKSDANDINKISNTTIPKVYESYWNKNLTASVFRYIKDAGGEITNFYAEMRKVPGLTSSSTPDAIPYEVKGKFLSGTIDEVAVSPKGDRIFTFALENGKGAGYVSGFDESKRARVLDTPLTQVNVDWPEENIVTVGTKASGVSSGYFYFLDLKKSTFTKILGGITGLGAKASSDAKKVIYSTASIRGIMTNLAIVKDGVTEEVVFRTLAEKCVWSKKYVNEVYCAVPTDIPPGLYPEEWYKGTISFVDQIWHLDTATGEVHLIANLTKLSNDLIDAINLKLDPKENFLYFVNKRDLTLWSLDLTQ